MINFARSSNHIPTLEINGQEIEKVGQAKLLGVTISNDLSWEAHINVITAKSLPKIILFKNPSACQCVCRQNASHLLLHCLTSGRICLPSVAWWTHGMALGFGIIGTKQICYIFGRNKKKCVFHSW